VTATDSKDIQVRYHDFEAGTYDAKWSISFDARCIAYARDRYAAAAPWPTSPYGVALEVGAGTGFFLLNLMTAGFARRGIVTDISSGMVQQALTTASLLGHHVAGAVADAEQLPFADGSVDAVVAHATIHHLPDVDRALREIVRVLRPGGRFVIAGEPTRQGDRIARRLSTATWQAAQMAGRTRRGSTWIRPADELAGQSAEAALEAQVDLHTFRPRDLAVRARRAGAREVHVHTDELTAAWVGWPVRTLEAAMRPERHTLRWSMGAYRTWIALGRVDRRLRPLVPPGLFYNVTVTGCAP
jgi:ubiquinone/menaquinone biosynthesis C-methylase UbiE